MRFIKKIEYYKEYEDYGYHDLNYYIGYNCKVDVKNIRPYSISGAFEPKYKAHILDMCDKDGYIWGCIKGSYDDCFKVLLFPISAIDVFVVGKDDVLIEKIKQHPLYFC